MKFLILITLLYGCSSPEEKFKEFVHNYYLGYCDGLFEMVQQKDFKPTRLQIYNNCRRCKNNNDLWTKWCEEDNK